VYELYPLLYNLVLTPVELYGLYPLLWKLVFILVEVYGLYLCFRI